MEWFYSMKSGDDPIIRQGCCLMHSWQMSAVNTGNAFPCIAITVTSPSFLRCRHCNSLCNIIFFSLSGRGWLVIPVTTVFPPLNSFLERLNFLSGLATLSVLLRLMSKHLIGKSDYELFIKMCLYRLLPPSRIHSFIHSFFISGTRPIEHSRHKHKHAHTKITNLHKPTQYWPTQY